MKRRDALKTMGALAGATAGTRLLGACGDNGLPPGIEHVVVVMMENRSYDHLLGARALEGLGGDGLTPAMTNAGRDGTLYAPYAATLGNMCVPDPPHGWDAAHASFAGGTNAGFVAAHQASHGDDRFKHPMEYLTRAHVPVSWALADEYTTCDRYFCSVMGPTWPNRMYWHSGSSNGIKSNDLPMGGFTWPASTTASTTRACRGATTTSRSGAGDRRHARQDRPAVPGRAFTRDCAKATWRR
jgi:phospholipase C